jgi:hypothetical protein
LLIKKGLVVGSTDSCWFNARVADSGDAFFGSGLILTWAANIPLQMVGTSGTQKLTTTGNIIPLIIHKNAGILQPQDSLNCNNILDSSSGTFDQDFGTRCTTAVFSGSDSIAMSGNMEIVKNLSFGLQAKENVTGSIKWIGSGAAICADSGTQLADVIIAKTAGQAWSSAGVLKTADFTGTTGDITIGAAATDTAYSVDVVLNNANVTVNAPWYVSGNFSCAGSTVFAFSPSGKIVMTNCVAATLNGNSVRIYYPTISPISYAASPWIDTIGKTATHAITITGCSLGKDSITNITAFPTGYSINKTTGLISWNGSGSQQSAASYTIRAYANAKTDSASVNISIEIYNPVKGKLSGLNTGLIIGTD